MPVGGMNSPGHDGHLMSYSNAGVQDSLRLNTTSAFCSGRSGRFDNVCAEIPQKETESQTATRSTRSDRYKTELCRQFGESGSCRYGDKCQFAHGVAELRVVERHPKYKTNLCRTFHSTGFCPYGARCHFIHGEASAPNLVLNSGLKTVRWSTVKQNSHPLDAVGISPTVYLTVLMGSTSVTPSLSCSDSRTPSPSPALSDVDIWKSLANAIGFGI